ncbi:MAG TPA: hypothetical protein VER55_09260 [Ardenticatenaceae bacterium]|nr:hypothetical protein [Ardenticatenaceae bacterium]
MSELLYAFVFVVYSILFWAAMAVGVLMTILVGMAVWSAIFRRR